MTAVHENAGQTALQFPRNFRVGSPAEQLIFCCRPRAQGSGRIRDAQLYALGLNCLVVQPQFRGDFLVRQLAQKGDFGWRPLPGHWHARQSQLKTLFHDLGHAAANLSRYDTIRCGANQVDFPLAQAGCDVQFARTGEKGMKLAQAKV